MDRRETAQQWYFRFDESRMVILLEDPHDIVQFSASVDSFLDAVMPSLGGDDDGDDEWDGGPSNVVPAYFTVCGTCDGKGTHVAPSIDSHGLSAEDFDEDPDFREAYFSGAYDVPCNECHGRRVTPDVNLDTLSPSQRKRVEDVQNSHWAEQREIASERTYGY